MKELCVVHLVRACNGIETFIRFLNSYRQNPGGIGHDLLIIFKGFDQTQDTEEYRALLANFRHVALYLSDDGVDITAYFAAVREYSKQYRYFCFLNSYSVIQDFEWLKKLYGNISRPGVGVVGASGSCESPNSEIHFWKKPIFYAIENYRLHQERNFPKRFVMSITEVVRHSRFRIGFDLFPNYHLRTNAFMISGDLMKLLKCPVVKNKKAAYKFESGSHGLTKSIIAMGKRVVVVGKDGLGYEMKDWRKSKTFRQSEQENLLVADNQTRDYQDGTIEMRCYLSSMAWGINHSGKD